MNKIIKFGLALILLISTSNNFDVVAQNEKKAQETLFSSKMKMNIDGMTCAMGCARAIEVELNNIDGVDKAKVDFESKNAVLSFNSELTSEAFIVDVVNKFKKGSYSATVIGGEKEVKKACCSGKKESCSSEQKVKCASKDLESSESPSSSKCTKPCCVKK